MIQHAELQELLHYEDLLSEEEYEHYFEILKEITISSRSVVRKFNSHKALKHCWFMLQVACVKAEREGQLLRNYLNLQGDIKVGGAVGRASLILHFRH